MLNDTPDSESRFDEDDIDTILERALTIKHSDESRGAGGLEAFAKASFCSADAAPNIDLDDPDFWKKVALSHFLPPSSPLSLLARNLLSCSTQGTSCGILEKKRTRSP